MSDTGIPISVEGLNPTRPYKYFRPRQAVRGFINHFPYSNGIMIQLYNDTTASYHLVVRDFAYTFAVNSTNRGFAYVQGAQGTAGGTIQNYMPGTAKLPGQIYFNDSSTIYNADYLPAEYSNKSSLDSFGWTHDFPFAVIPPGWGLVFSYGNSGFNVAMSFIWEAVAEEELDYLW